MPKIPSDEIYTSMIQPKGSPYKKEKIESYSRYNQPIDRSEGRLAGNSRIWGDASQEVQSRAIDALIASGERAGLSPREIGHVLAIARVESGFNPDAAAGTTSAYGLGQFVNKTGKAYGINDTNRDDPRMQADVLVAHYKDNADLARRRGKGEDYIYKYHHDGPSAEHGGLAISKKKVTPYIDKYEQFVIEHQNKYGIEPPDPSMAQRVPVSSASGTTLRQGSSGTTVTNLQNQLNALNYTDARGTPIEADGKFGPATHAALQKFQRDHGLTADGVAGLKTFGKLEEVQQHQLLIVQQEYDQRLHAFMAVNQKFADNLVSRIQETGESPRTASRDILFPDGKIADQSMLNKPEGTALSIAHCRLNEVGETMPTPPETTLTTKESLSI